MSGGGGGGSGMMSGGGGGMMGGGGGMGGKSCFLYDISEPLNTCFYSLISSHYELYINDNVWHFTQADLVA
jgi:hypothetical protein